jgi:hypothetical protein
MESRALSAGERGFRKLLKRKLLGLASLERTIARQRSMITRLAEGDDCTKFFQLHANHRHWMNFIAQLKVDRTLVSDQDAKADAVDAFFEHLLGSSPERDFSLDLDFLAFGPTTCPSWMLLSTRKRSAAWSAHRIWKKRLPQMVSPAGSTCLVSTSSSLMSWMPSVCCGVGIVEGYTWTTWYPSRPSMRMLWRLRTSANNPDSKCGKPGG